MRSVEPYQGQMSDSFRVAIFIILSGGFQDAYTYCCRGSVFANAQTGNVVLLSTALFQQEWGIALKYFIPVMSFLIGTAAAEFIHIRLKCCQKIHWRQIVLLFEILLLFAVGFLPQVLDPLANALVSFVCALQVQSFHKVRGHVYASTMCIGNLRTATEALCTYLRKKDRSVLQKCLIYFAVIGIFGIGAGIGGVLTLAVGRKAIWIGCLLLSVSFAMMFTPEKSKQICEAQRPQ